MLRRRCVGLWRRSTTAEKSAKSALICGLLAERFHRGDRTTDDPTDYAANGIPAAHPQPAKRATGELANTLVISFLVIRSKLLAQAICFSLKIAKLNSGRSR